MVYCKYGFVNCKHKQLWALHILWYLWTINVHGVTKTIWYKYVLMFIVFCFYNPWIAQYLSSDTIWDSKFPTEEEFSGVTLHVTLSILESQIQGEVQKLNQLEKEISVTFLGTPSLYFTLTWELLLLFYVCIPIGRH